MSVLLLFRSCRLIQLLLKVWTWDLAKEREQRTRTNKQGDAKEIVGAQNKEMEERIKQNENEREEKEESWCWSELLMLPFLADATRAKLSLLIRNQTKSQGLIGGFFCPSDTEDSRSCVWGESLIRHYFVSRYPIIRQGMNTRIAFRPRGGAFLFHPLI